MQTNVSYLKEYEINRYTMAILPVMIGNDLFSRIIEVEDEFIVAMKPIEIVDRSCRYYGSSLKGRREGTKEMMGITHKAPIIIEASNKIYFFPTASPRIPRCAWLSHIYILDKNYAGHEKTNVIFTTKKSIQINVSLGSFESQLYRTAQLRTVMSNRMDLKDKKMNFIMTPPKQKEEILFHSLVEFDHSKIKAEKNK
ncbi:competence protein ComK [Fredinandcohnia quinoae]|uniref:Competence protein ComK n=1 Tax=Fredinandcohnia quinoae TaxID=2918902 RepID=A0AAW5E6J2_9BACI|nr:competence protein ComK [Fredinandcohnia sp. SECRCQ15]MCH1626855.1 competence protein ComK [Fredinandcohnia sp. SECRCQ15]